MEATVALAWPLGGVVAVTKLHAPRQRPALVPREALVDVLRRGVEGRLALVTGPAGAGKTTLLSQWRAAAAPEQPFAWLSLDPEDADPARFWRCVIEALRTVHPHFGARSEPALRLSGAPLCEVVMPLLVNDLAALERPTVLVLDDLHAIGPAPEVHQSLAFLVDHLPPTLHVALASRTEPALPVARLRARGELTEIRTADLRFSDTEAGELLQLGFGIELAGGQLARLQARTEGWAAGLLLAGVSLGRRGADFESFMRAFGADQSDVLAYLGAEVLEGLPGGLREFLLQTSILDRLCGELCDGVTGRGDSVAQLHELEQRNLLLLPLDETRHWWRYHHLFAELLRRELLHGEPPEAIAELHRRAAAWHRAHGAPADAIRHALAAGDTDGAAELVALHWEPAFNRGELLTVSRWLEQLPAAAVEADARLWLASTWTAMDSGRLAEAGRLVEQAQSGTAPELRRWAPLLGALHAFKCGDVGAAAAGAAAARADPSDDPFRETVAALVEAVSAYWGNRPAAAASALEQAAAFADRHGNLLGLAYALGYAALIDAEAGHVPRAEAHLDRIEALRMRDEAIGEHFIAFATALARGRLLERRAAYDSAAEAFERAVALARRGAGRLEIAAPLLSLADVQRARGRREEAARLGAEAERILRDCPDPGRLARRRAATPAAAVSDDLSDSELAVLRLLPTGLSQREIGAQLYVSINTVKTHCRNIYAKLHVGSREGAVRRARELDLL